MSNRIDASISLIQSDWFHSSQSRPTISSGWFQLSIDDSISSIPSDFYRWFNPKAMSNWCVKLILAFNQITCAPHLLVAEDALRDMICFVRLIPSNPIGFIQWWFQPIDDSIRSIHTIQSIPSHPSDSSCWSSMCAPHLLLAGDALQERYPFRLITINLSNPFHLVVSSGHGCSPSLSWIRFVVIERIYLCLPCFLRSIQLSISSSQSIYSNQSMIVSWECYTVFLLYQED